MTEHPVTDSLADPGPEPRPRAASRRSGTSSTPNIDANEGADVHLMDYVMVVYKRRRMALTAFVLVVAGVTVYSFTATPIYEARTRLLIEAEQQNVVDFKQVVEEDQTKADYYQTQYNVLQSRALARRTLDELQLWEKAPFGDDGTQSLIGRLAATPAMV